MFAQFRKRVYICSKSKEMTRQQFIASVLYSLATSDITEAREMTLKQAYDLVNERANEEDFDDDKTDPDKLPDKYWDNAPDWAEWAAMDEHGIWCWYGEKPTLRINDWSNMINYNCFTAPAVPDWKDSLTKRPCK